MYNVVYTFIPTRGMDSTIIQHGDIIGYLLCVIPMIFKSSSVSAGIHKLTSVIYPRYKKYIIIVWFRAGMVRVYSSIELDCQND